MAGKTDTSRLTWMEAVTTRKSALPLLRFFEGLRGLIACALEEWPTPDQLRAHCSDRELVELIEDARASLREEPGRPLAGGDRAGRLHRAHERPLAGHRVL